MSGVSNRVYSHTLSDGSLVIIQLIEGTPPQEAYYLSKMLFELHRGELTNPSLDGEELEGWRRNVHFDSYTGSRPWVAREITGESLPDRSRRHAWRDNGNRVFDDTRIPNR